MPAVVPSACPPVLPTGQATSSTSATSDVRAADSLQDWGRGRVLGVGRLVTAAPVGEDGVFPPAGVLLSVELSGVSLHCFLQEGQNEEGSREARAQGGSTPPNLPPVASGPQAKRGPMTCPQGDTPAQGPRPGCPP